MKSALTLISFALFISIISCNNMHQHSKTTKFKAKPGQLTPQKPEIVKNEVVIDKADDGIQIADLYAKKSNYNGKTVKVRGKVTKYNPGIMGKNWVHLQDGTDHNGNFDLTVTTQAEVSLGAVVTFEGTIALNKDFGAGYSYSLIMEKAELIK